MHVIKDNTDFFQNHPHEIAVTAGVNIPIPGTNKHIRVVKGRTTLDDGHVHEVLFTTQIENPLV